MSDPAFPDWRRAPNIADHPEVYELENEALDPDGLVLRAMRDLADWRGRAIVDLGCGTGFWLPVYARDAARVVGLEPDPALLARARGRVGGRPGVEVAAGSAERMPLPDGSVDLVHARFAYFFPPQGEAGLAEAMRVLRPGGSLVAVDNDWGWGQFADLLARSPWVPPGYAAEADAWWRERGAERRDVRSAWRFRDRADLEAVLSIEFPAELADAWLAEHPDATGLTYGFALFRMRRPGLG